MHWLNSPFTAIRGRAIMEVSGNHIMHFLDLFDMSSLQSDISYPLDEEYSIQYDQTWLQGFVNLATLNLQPEEVESQSVQLLMRLFIIQDESLTNFFMECWKTTILQEGFLNKKEKEYFGLDNAIATTETSEVKSVHPSKDSSLTKKKLFEILSDQGYWQTKHA